jgi:hypothetical protein
MAQAGASNVSAAVLLAYAPALVACAWWLGIVRLVGVVLGCWGVLVALGGEAGAPSPGPLPPPEVTPHFTFQLQYSPLGNLQGLTVSQWLELLGKRWRQVEWNVYWFRILHISCMSLLNSCISSYEWLRFGKAPEQCEINDAPVFVLGHPRTGTTHLHNLLALDSDQFIFPTTFQCTMPNVCVALDGVKHVVEGAIPDRRPMDNVKLTFETPQEDELALYPASGGCSPYGPLNFMTDESSFRPYFSFESAPAEDRRRWTDALFWFMRRVTFSWERQGASKPRRPDGAPPRRLIMKSPCHVSRLALLRQLFPKAQFVYIHRNPYVVWKSAVNMAEKTYWYFYLARPSDAQITDFILNQYEVLFEDFQRMKKDVPREQLVEISYDALSRDTIGTLRGIYSQLRWGDDAWARVKPKLEAYLATQESYVKNNFVPLAEPVRKYVYQRWKRSFDDFGYAEEQTADDL